MTIVNTVNIPHVSFVKPSGENDRTGVHLDIVVDLFMGAEIFKTLDLRVFRLVAIIIATCLLNIFCIPSTASAKENYAFLDVFSTEDLCPTRNSSGRSFWNVQGEYVTALKARRITTQLWSSNLNPLNETPTHGETNVPFGRNSYLREKWINDKFVQKEKFDTWKHAIVETLAYAQSNGICIPENLRFVMSISPQNAKRFRIAIPRNDRGENTPVIHIPYNRGVKDGMDGDMENSVPLGAKYAGLPLSSEGKAILHELGHILHQRYSGRYYWGFDFSVDDALQKIEFRNILEENTAILLDANQALEKAKQSCFTRKSTLTALKTKIAQFEASCASIAEKIKDLPEIETQLKQHIPLQKGWLQSCQNVSSYGPKDQRECIAEIFTAAWIGADVSLDALVFYAAAGGPPLNSQMEDKLRDGLANIGQNPELRNELAQLVLTARIGQKVSPTLLMNKDMSRELLQRFASIQNAVTETYFPLQESEFFRQRVLNEIKNIELEEYEIPTNLILKFYVRMELIHRSILEKIRESSSEINANKFDSLLSNALVDVIAWKDS